MTPAPSSQLLFDEAERRGYSPRWLSDYGFFVIEVEGQLLPFYMTYSAGNSQISSWITRDKHATRVWLAAQQFPNIPFCFTSDWKVVHQFLNTHQEIIAKPVVGERAHGVQKIGLVSEIESFDLDATLFEKYIAGTEYRILLLDQQVIGVQKKELRSQPDHPWRKNRTNLDQSTVHQSPLLSAMAAQSTTIAERLSQGILAVDWIIDSEEQPYILELNSAPGFQRFVNPDAGESIQVVGPIFEFLLAELTSAKNT